MNHFKVALLFAVLLLMLSCSNHSLLNEVLDSAGSNRSELEAVLNHYRTIDINPEKLRAAEYLIENLSAHYSYDGNNIQEYYDYAAQILADATLTPEQQRDSLLLVSDKKYRDLSNHTVPDAQIIKASFLIDNIDKSYSQWTSCPWASQLTFDDYLEWLLPYKAVELQDLDCWRDTLLHHFGNGLSNPIKNDVENGTTMGVADMIRNNTYKGVHRYGLYTRAGLPLLSSYLLPRQTYGDIPDYALLAVLTLRAAGIPAVIDETPVGARNTAASRWFVILSDRGQELTSEWDLSTMIGGSFFPYERGPKVYRHTYRVNRQRKVYLKHAKWIYPFELGREDVTERYFLSSDIHISIEKHVRSMLADKYVYITSAIRNGQDSQPVTGRDPVPPGWKIVDFGEIRHGKACFNNMGREVLYLALGYDGNGLVPISDPFILHKNGALEFVSVDTVNSIFLDKWRNNNNNIRP